MREEDFSTDFDPLSLWLSKYVKEKCGGGHIFSTNYNTLHQFVQWYLYKNICDIMITLLKLQKNGAGTGWEWERS